MGPAPLLPSRCRMRARRDPTCRRRHRMRAHGPQRHHPLCPVTTPSLSHPLSVRSFGFRPPRPTVSVRKKKREAGVERGVGVGGKKRNEIFWCMNTTSFCSVPPYVRYCNVRRVKVRVSARGPCIDDTEARIGFRAWVVEGKDVEGWRAPLEFPKSPLRRKIHICFVDSTRSRNGSRVP